MKVKEMLENPERMIFGVKNPIENTTTFRIVADFLEYNIPADEN